MKRRVFLEGTDVMKAEIFASNKGYRKPIDDKVATWVREGWATWEEEKPEWFTDRWKESVPKYMRPAKKERFYRGDKIAAENEGGNEALTVGEGDEQKGRRRNSILELISGQAPLPSKVMPVGVIEKELDEEHFMREMNRRGMMTM